MEEIKKILSAPSVRFGFGMAIFAVLIAAIWKIRRAVMQNKSVTSYGLKGNGEITAARAQILAEKLWDAMRKYGTDENAIAAVYDELSQYRRAVLQVHEAFGLNRYLLGAADFFGVKLNLRQWLKKELSAKEYALWDLLYNEAVNG